MYETKALIALTNGSMVGVLTYIWNSLVPSTLHMALNILAKQNTLLFDRYDFDMSYVHQSSSCSVMYDIIFSLINTGLSMLGDGGQNPFDGTTSKVQYSNISDFRYTALTHYVTLHRHLVAEVLV